MHTVIQYNNNNTITITTITITATITMIVLLLLSFCYYTICIFLTLIFLSENLHQNESTFLHKRQYNHYL